MLAPLPRGPAWPDRETEKKAAKRPISEPAFIRIAYVVCQPVEAL
jgi:hypothetical protein